MEAFVLEQERQTKRDILYESKVESISVEIKENVSNLAELNKLHDLLQEYDSYGKVLTNCVNNSKNFSNLFPYSSAVPEKIENNVIDTEEVVNIKQKQDTESKKKIADIRDRVAGMASFDDMLMKVKNEQKDKYDVHKQIHKALKPTSYELSRAHMKRRQRNRARIILLRFCKKCFDYQRRNRAARKIHNCFLFYLRVVKTHKKVIVIQTAWRRYLAKKRCANMKDAGARISREIKRKILANSTKRKLHKLIRVNTFCIKIQSRMRGIRGRRLVSKLRQDLKESKAAVTIQNMYWAKCGGSRLEALMETYRKKLTDNDDVMILHKIIRPRSITEARGKWVTLGDREDEGLVEEIDVRKNMLVVMFGDVHDVEEYEISFKSSDIIQWYTMSSKEQQAIEEHSARIIQKAIRFKLSKTFYFNRPVCKAQVSSSSAINDLYVTSDDTIRHCLKPKLNHSKGYYVESSVVPNRKGLVEMYDLEQGLIRVVYDADDFLLEKVYNYKTDNLTWYSNSNLENSDSLRDLERLESEVTTAADAKSNYRGRRAMQRMQQVKERESLQAARRVIPPLTAFHKKLKPPLESSPGYWILSPSKALAGTPGFVQSVDENKLVLKVDLAGDTTRTVRVNYLEKGLKWCHPEIYAQEEAKKLQASGVRGVGEGPPETHNSEQQEQEQEQHVHAGMGGAQTTVPFAKSTVVAKNVRIEETKEEHEDKEKDKAVITPDHSISFEENAAAASSSDSDSEEGRIDMTIFLPTTCPDVNTSLDNDAPDVFILVPSRHDGEESSKNTNENEADEIGKIMQLNFKNGMAVVHFINSASSPEDIKYDHETEEVPFLTREMKWLKLVPASASY